MIFYHGSKQIINKPIKNGSNPHNDYGPSFYLTSDLMSAKSWACKNDELGCVNKYNIRSDDFSKLKILDLTNKETYSVLNWIAVLIHFRNLEHLFVQKNQEAINWLSKYYIDVNQYDVVIGFRADDSYFRFPKEFINGNLAFEDLEKVFMLGELGIQYAFMSEKAISKLKFINATTCEESFLGKYHGIVIDAAKTLDEILSQPKLSSKTYILDLMRKDHD